jgi:hypothetical protein
MFFYVSEVISTFCPWETCQLLSIVNIKKRPSGTDNLPELSDCVSATVRKLLWLSLCKHVRCPNVFNIVRNSGNTVRDESSFRAASVVMESAPQDDCWETILA